MLFPLRLQDGDVSPEIIGPLVIVIAEVPKLSVEPLKEAFGSEQA